MKTAHLLSFLPGIRKLLAENEWLRKQTGALRTRVNRLGGGGVPGVPFRPAGVPPYFLVERLKLAYLQVPKAACSSIQAAILALDQPEAYQALRATSERFVSALHHTPELYRTTRDAEAYLRVTFVRHPLKRVISFYHDQVNPPEPVSDQFKERLTKELAPFGFVVGMGFEDYIAKILGSEKAQRNPHIRPQCELVFGPEGTRVDFLGRVENLPRDWELLNRLSGGELGELPRLNVATGNLEPGQTAKLDERMNRRLAAHYRHDLAIFGYPAEIPRV